MKKLIAGVWALILITGCGESATGTIEDLAAKTGPVMERLAETYDVTMETASGHLDELAEKWTERPIRVCEMTDDAMFDFVGGLMSGTALTGYIAGDSIIAVATAYGYVAVVMPAVATSIVIGASSAAVGYAGLKAYCMDAPVPEAAGVL